jgi:lipopolysaccharide biosynthesis glycosyltransferase
MEQYEKIMFVDSDLFIWDSMEELFRVTKGQEFAAVLDDYIHLAGGRPYGNQNYFNAAMFILRPNRKVYENMKLFIGNSPQQLKDLAEWNKGLAEQDFLNFYYGAGWYHLPKKYNLIHFTKRSQAEVNSSIAIHDKFWQGHVVNLLPKHLQEIIIQEYENSKVLISSNGTKGTVY